MTLGLSVFKEFFLRRTDTEIELCCNACRDEPSILSTARDPSDWLGLHQYIKAATKHLQEKHPEEVA